MRGYVIEVAFLVIKEKHNALTKQKSLQHTLVNARGAVCAYCLCPEVEEIIQKTCFCSDCVPPGRKNIQECSTQIRSFLENSEGQYKVILCCSDSCKLQILKPIGRVIHPPPHSNKEIVGILNFISKQEVIDLPHKLAETMAGNSQHCLRQAIRSFEATWLADYPYTEGQLIMTSWEDELAIMAKSIIEEQSLTVLFLVRKKIINLMEHRICKDFILSTLAAELNKHAPDSQTQLDLESFIPRNYQDYWCGERKLSHKDEVLLLGNQVRDFLDFLFRK